MYNGLSEDKPVQYRNNNNTGEHQGGPIHVSQRDRHEQRETKPDGNEYAPYQRDGLKCHAETAKIQPSIFRQEFTAPPQGQSEGQCERHCSTDNGPSKNRIQSRLEQSDIRRRDRR